MRRCEKPSAFKVADDVARSGDVMVETKPCKTASMKGGSMNYKILHFEATVFDVLFSFRFTSDGDTPMPDTCTCIVCGDVAGRYVVCSDVSGHGVSLQVVRESGV